MEKDWIEYHLEQERELEEAIEASYDELAYESDYYGEQPTPENYYESTEILNGLLTRVEVWVWGDYSLDVIHKPAYYTCWDGKLPF